MKFYLSLALLAVLSATVLGQTTSKPGTTTSSPKTTAPVTTSATTSVETTSASTETTAADVTTAAPATTSVSPTGSASPVGHWNVTDDDGTNKTVVCILAQMGASFTSMSTNETMVLTPDIKDDGNCVKNKTFISWSRGPYHLTFLFGQDNDNFYVSNIIIENDVSSDTANLAGKLFQTAISNSYQCKSTLQYVLIGKKDNYTMTVHDVQLQAFRTARPGDANAGQYADGVPCDADQPPTSNIVPIAVGAALAGLVVIVLIAYLIGRRRNRQGYESV